MRCPKCKDKSEVLKTEAGAIDTKRRRQCLNPACRFRFVTREQQNTPNTIEVTTESVMADFNLKKGRAPNFDAEAVAAAIAVEKRKAAIRREQKAAERSPYDDLYDAGGSPGRLSREELRREIEGY